MAEKKGYIIINKIPNVFEQPKVKLDEVKGTFIECPHCKKLLNLTNKMKEVNIWVVKKKYIN